MPTRRALGAALAAIVFLAIPAMAQPTMDELWPSQDGNSWTYAQRYESFSWNPTLVENRTRIFFDGEVIAPTGIPAQYLRQEPISGPVLAASEPGIDDPFLRQLWQARPDLRAKILARLADADCPEYRASGSYGYFLTGELAFRKTPDEIAAWRCNRSYTRAWLWLVSDVTIMSTFTLQLVPDLADDVFLHGMVVAVEPVTVPAGTFKNCVRVDYKVDYGLSECTDNSGNPIGTSRSETRGYVHYAPGTGPVDSFEEFVEGVETTGNCLGTPGGTVISRVTLQMDTTPTPVRRATWGQLKLVYR